MNDLERAKALLVSSTHTCVLCKGEITYVSDRTGIAPMMEFLDLQTDLVGFSAADRIVGKAAAMLFALAGVREIYAEVLSERAIPILQKYGIGYSYGRLTPVIINRKGDGACPMENAVEHLEEPVAAREAIRKTLELLKKG
ncbi:MAG: DUF1893 domain-containing protein [Clostridia bacterium]|nr:DUF1893 domain-containing protein [Clostridia bacterium]